MPGGRGAGARPGAAAADSSVELPQGPESRAATRPAGRLLRAAAKLETCLGRARAPGVHCGANAHSVPRRTPVETRRSDATGCSAAVRPPAARGQRAGPGPARAGPGSARAGPGPPRAGLRPAVLGAARGGFALEQTRRPQCAARAGARGVAADALAPRLSGTGMAAASCVRLARPHLQDAASATALGGWAHALADFGVPVTRTLQGGAWRGLLAATRAERL